VEKDCIDEEFYLGGCIGLRAFNKVIEEVDVVIYRYRYRRRCAVYSMGREDANNIAHRMYE
jgi:hypothetical protein